MDISFECGKGDIFTGTASFDVEVSAFDGDAVMELPIILTWHALVPDEGDGFSEFDVAIDSCRVPWAGDWGGFEHQFYKALTKNQVIRDEIAEFCNENHSEMESADGEDY